MCSSFTVLQNSLMLSSQSWIPNSINRWGTSRGFGSPGIISDYSKIYGAVIALSQIAGAILLTFRKTTLLGACLLFPIVVNIVLVDIFYGVDLGATIMAIFVLIGLVILLLIHKQELIALFWCSQNRLFPEASSGNPLATMKWLVRLTLILIAVGSAYYTANYNNINPTILDGVWNVTKVGPHMASQQIPSTIFFERNRAGLCVFKFADGTYQSHNFEVNSKTNGLQVWRDPSRAGPAIFVAQYAISPNDLSLKGKFAGIDDEVTIDLHRRD